MAAANVATRCRNGNGIYVTRSANDTSDTLVVIPADPACLASGATPGTPLPR